MKKLRLIRRASALNIANKSTSEKIIINIHKIEQVILMWRKIKYLTVTSARANLKTIDIPIDSSVSWNKIKEIKNLQFKTIDDPILIDQLIADRNAHHLNQADETPFPIEPLISLIGKDTFTTFSKELLEGKANLDQLNLSPTTRLYMKNLKQNNRKLTNQYNNTL